MNEIATVEELNNTINSNEAALVYYSHPECNVCKVLLPKIQSIVKDKFQEIKLFYVNSEKAKKLAASQSVFSVPTIVVYFSGKEFNRKSRNLNMNEFVEELSRPYFMMFDQ